VCEQIKELSPTEVENLLQALKEQSKGFSEKYSLIPSGLFAVIDKVARLQLSEHSLELVVEYILAKLKSSENCSSSTNDETFALLESLTERNYPKTLIAQIISLTEVNNNNQLSCVTALLAKYFEKHSLAYLNLPQICEFLSFAVTSSNNSVRSAGLTLSQTILRFINLDVFTE